MGSEGILVFGNYTLENCFRFYTYYWVNGKLVVNDDLVGNRLLPLLTGTGEGNFGLMVRYNKFCYVTNMPADPGDCDTYRLVDPLVLMKYVDGKINRRQLARHARTVEFQRKQEISRKELRRRVAELEAMVTHGDAILASAQRAHREYRMTIWPVLDQGIRSMEFLTLLLNELKRRRFLRIVFGKTLWDQMKPCTEPRIIVK